MKRFTYLAVIVLITLLTVYALWTFRAAVVLFALSVAVGAGLRPVVDRLTAEGWPLRLALAAVYAAALATLGVLIYVFGAEVIHELPTGEELASWYQDIDVTWRGAGGVRGAIGERLPSLPQLRHALAHLHPGGVGKQALDTTAFVLSILGQTLIVIVLSLYWSADRHVFERLWLSLLPVATRVRARAVWTETRAAAGAHLRREIGQSVGAATLLGLLLAAVGCAYWGIAAVAVALLRLIPLLGIFLAVVAAGLAGLLTDPPRAALAAGLTLAVLLGLRLYVAPRVLAAPRLNPILAVLTVLGLAWYHGFVGLLVAPLLAASIQTAFGELIASHPTDDRPPSLERLQARLDVVAQTALVVPQPPELASVFERLRRLVARAGDGAG